MLLSSQQLRETTFSLALAANKALKKDIAVNMLNTSFITHMPLISILLGFLCIWMVTFLILSLRSSSQKEPGEEVQVPRSEKPLAGTAVNAQQVVALRSRRVEAMGQQSYADIERTQVVGVRR